MTTQPITQTSSFIDGIVGITLGLAFIIGGIAAVLTMISGAAYLGDGSHAVTLVASIATLISCVAVIRHATRF